MKLDLFSIAVQAVNAGNTTKSQRSWGDLSVYSDHATIQKVEALEHELTTLPWVSVIGIYDAETGVFR